MNQISPIKFEADEQRQHARYKLPLRVVIDGKAYDCIDWSVAGIGIATPRKRFEPDSVQEIRLIFPFSGMDFALEMKAEVRYSSTEIGRTGFKYVEVTDDQQRLLRYILEAHLSGDVVTAGEVLDLQRRAVEAKPRSVKGVEKPKTLLGRLAGSTGSILRSALATLIIVVLIAFVGSSIVQRIAVIPAQSGFASIDLNPVLAGVSGTVTNIASGNVSTGQPVATILTANGNSQTQLSTCDCSIETASVAVDTQVRVGDTIALLRPVGQKPYVVALVSRAAVVDLMRGVTVQVELFDGTILNGATISALPKLTGADPEAPVPVAINVGDNADKLAVGQAVQVRFIRNNALGIQYLSDFLREVGRLIGVNK